MVSMAHAKLEVEAGAPNPFAIKVEARDDDELLGVVAGYYHATLLADTTARTWLQQRGLGADDLVEHFGLGFANRTLGLRRSKTCPKGVHMTRGSKTCPSQRLKDLPEGRAHDSVKDLPEGRAHDSVIGRASRGSSSRR
jgi:hypothetical protein